MKKEIYPFIPIAGLFIWLKKRQKPMEGMAFTVFYITQVFWCNAVAQTLLYLFYYYTRPL